MTLKQKLAAVLAAAAAIVVGVGLPLRNALWQAGIEQGMTCEEWDRAVADWGDDGHIETYFVAVNGSPSMPEAIGNRDLGTCGASTCTIERAGCEAVYTYTYSKGPPVNGWRLIELHAHPYIGGAYKAWAASAAGVKFFESFSAVIAKCQANFTNAECLQVLDADNRCWLLDDGTCCRHGERGCAPTSSGRNGQACPYGQVVAVMPCTVNRGAGSERTDAARVWTDAELDL